MGQGQFGPYLGNVARDAVTIAWRTLEPGTTVVRFGSDSSYGQATEELAATVQHEVRLEGLTPGSSLHYQIESRSAAGDLLIQSSDQRVRLAPDGIAPFRFALLAEVHEEEAVADFDATLASFDPAFQIQTGDNVDQGDDLAQWERFFSQGDWYGRVPLFNVMGNHNFETSDGSLFSGDGELTLELLDQPGNERWYSFEYGGVLLVGLDTNQHLYDPTVAEQPQWLEALLTEATDGVDDPGLIVAFLHVPPFSTCGACAYREVIERPWVRDELVERFERFGVHLVLMGHDKIYERTVVNGVTYVQVSSGADPRDTDRPDLNPDAVVSRADVRSALFVEVMDGCVATLEARDPSGNLIDETTVDCAVPKGPQPSTVSDESGCSASSVSPVSLRFEAWLLPLLLALGCLRRRNLAAAPSQASRSSR